MANYPRLGYVTDVRNMPSAQSLVQAGITPLLMGWDPNLRNAYATAAAAGANPGLWFPANSMSAEEYAKKVIAVMQQYPNASWADLNIEFPGVGPMGSPQYDYTEQVMAMLQPYLKPGQFSASPMGMQGNNFNYNAILARGGMLSPQAYWGNMDPMDPNAVVQQLIDAGIPADRIRPLLGWGNPSNVLGNLYAIDQGGWQGKFPAGSPLVTPLVSSIMGTRTPAVTGPGKDAKNPKAIQYATNQIQRLFDTGLIKKRPSGDPTLAWRQLSQSPAVQSRIVNDVFDYRLAPKVMPPPTWPVATNEMISTILNEMRQQLGQR